jgi:hypothetical protein
MRIERRRGDTRPDVCTINIAGTFDSANITGCTFKLIVSSVPFPVDNTSEVYEVAGTITDAENGVVEFAPASDQVDKTGFYYYELKMVDTYGKLHTLVSDVYLFR